MTDLSVRPQQLASILRHMLPAGLAPLLVSPPGIGKTDIVRQVAEQLGYLCSHPATSDPTDFRGLRLLLYRRLLANGDLSSHDAFRVVGSLQPADLWAATSTAACVTCCRRRFW